MRNIRTCALCVCLSAAALWSQSFLSSITGTVVDPTGAVVSGAKVVATETRTGVAHESVSNNSGGYLVADLVPGRYSVTITSPGFKELRSGEIILTGNQVQRFDGRLDVGATSETVEVAASAPTVNTEDAQIAGVESREELTLLPTNQRSTITLFMLNSYNYHGVGSSYSMGGLRGVDTSLTIDGNTSNSNTFGNQSGPQTEVSFESL